MDCDTIDLIYLDYKIEINKSCTRVYTSTTGKYYQTGVVGEDFNIRQKMYDIINSFPCASTLSLEKEYKSNSILRLRSQNNC
jgi:hypothetical protein